MQPARASSRSSSSGKKREVRRMRQGRPLIAPHQLAQVLGRGLGDAVDVARHRRDVLGDPRRRASPPRASRARPNVAGSAGEDKSG